MRTQEIKKAFGSILFLSRFIRIGGAVGALLDLVNAADTLSIKANNFMADVGTTYKKKQTYKELADAAKELEAKLSEFLRVSRIKV